MTFNEGDQVYVYSNGYRPMSRGVISRVTKTQAIIATERFEQRFNRETGRMIGGDAWNSALIAHPNEKLDREWHEANVRAARRRLEVAAAESDPAAIRAAYARWDALESGTVHDA